MGIISKLTSTGVRLLGARTLAPSVMSQSTMTSSRDYSTDTPKRPYVTMPQIANHVTSEPGVTKEADRVTLYTAYNGEKVANVFPPSEFQARLDHLRVYMAKNNIGACVLTSYHNIAYYTGFLFCYFGRSYACVVTQDTVNTVSAGIDGGQPWRRGYGDNVVYTDWEKTNYYTGVKESAGGVKGKIALEFDHVTLENFPKFRQLFPNRDIVDIGQPTMYMRLKKSPAELEVIRHGARVADVGGAAIVEALHEGVPEHEVALHSTRTMVREIANTFPQSDILDTWTWFQSGINTDGAHNPVTTKKVRSGDILSLNCFPMIQGYYTALERTMFLNHASDEHLRVWQINVDVHKRGLELIQPGARCCDIALELNEMYREKDLLQYRSFGYGHSFGVLCHYYGREAGLELREDITTEIEPGMVVSMEPMLMIPENREGAGGYREHDILIVTETGAENITKFPFGPEHNIVKK